MPRKPRKSRTGWAVKTTQPFAPTETTWASSPARLISRVSPPAARRRRASIR